MAWTRPDAPPIRSLEEFIKGTKWALCLLALKDGDKERYEVAYYEFESDTFFSARGLNLPGEIFNRDDVLGYQRIFRYSMG